VAIFLLHCVRSLLAPSGLSETSARLSAFGQKRTYMLAWLRPHRSLNDPQETCAGQDFRDAKMNRCGQRLRDRSPRGRSQPERVRRIGAPMSVSEKDTRDVARIWTDRRIPAACRGAVFHDQIVESSWSRSPRLSRVKSIFPCRPCMAIAWADISAVMSPRQYLGMAVRSEETSTIQPDCRSASTRRTISAIFGAS
jgi:hypothetical protein